MRTIATLSLFSLFGATLLLAACTTSTPQVIEVIREVPQTVIVTQVITQIVTLEPPPTATETPSPVIYPTATPTFLPLPPTPNPAEERALRKMGFYVYYPIEGCGPSIVQVGFDVYVSLEGGKNAIRNTPDISSAHNIIGYALPGEHLQVISGPVCSWGWLMWMVETDYGLTGWTPESDGKSFWLIPMDPPE
ncbi:MAG: hypothetical protein NZ840_09845 [Anaerolineales bacterium]|nr:hypothetical protein [Anaerolineales bacterium]MDW8162344.1 hypothetical protein [Anaerolineales bacterium]